MNAKEKPAKKSNALLIVVSVAVVLAVLYVCGGFVVLFFMDATPRGTGTASAEVLSVEVHDPTKTPSSK
jgi:flagellar basal body-associated protein FliL